jgi:[ribosomal protein S5]-alanine N-acetyltransferase
VDGPRLRGAGIGGRLNAGAPPAPAPSPAAPGWPPGALAAGLAAAERGLPTPRLQLEPLGAAHAAELWPLLADPALYAHVPQEPPPDAAWLAHRYALLGSRRSPDGDELWLNWVLRRRADAACIGSVQVTVYPDAAAYLAYELGRTAWHQGFATEACTAVLAALRSGFGVQRVVAEVDSLNAPSLRLLDRLGFERTGMRRDADFFKGRRSDEVRFEKRLGGAG